MASLSSRSVTVMAAAAALAIAPVACGDGGDDKSARAPAQELAAPLGKPLPPELVGSWYEDPKGDDTKWRTSFLAAGHELCLEVVETRGNCYFGEAAAGGAVLEGDALGQPLMFSYGEVGMSGDELVFRMGLSPDEGCKGSRHTAAWTLRDEQLVLEQTSAECGLGAPRTIRLDRAG